MKFLNFEILYIFFNFQILYFDPPTMVYRPPYPWYFDPPAHGILTPLPMVYQTLLWYYELLSFGRNEEVKHWYAIEF
jgi:hypothetical protein